MVTEKLDLDTKAIAIVLVFPQADLDVPVYMELPAGMYLEGEGSTSTHYVLKLDKSSCGLKQSSLSWHDKLK